MFNKLLCKIERYLLNKTNSKSNYIIFESDEHHIFDNSYSLYRYLTQYKKLKLFYVVYKENQYKEAIKKKIKKKRIIFISNRVNIHQLKNARYLLRIKLILRKCSLCFISYRNFYEEYKIKFHSDQVMVNLRHGEFPIKNVTDYYKGLFFPYRANMFFRVGTNESLKLLPKELTELDCKWFASPMPRNDYLLVNKKEYFIKLIDGHFFNNNTKVILCMTTLRKNEHASYFKTQFPLPFDEIEFNDLNNLLTKNNVILLIKVHHDNLIHDEDGAKIKYTNILLIDDNDLEQNNLFVNDILQYSDMLITDYSSVLFDYLYFDRPISFIISDLNSFSKTNGLFSTDFLSVGNIVKTFDDLNKVIIDLINGVDNKHDTRSKYHILYNGNESISGCETVTRLFINPRFIN